MQAAHYEFPDAVIQIFCKAPVAGQVKTRLMPQLSAEQAAAVHQQLSLRTFALVSSLKLCPVQLWCAPSIQHPFFIKAAEDYSLSLYTQANGDLGERMDSALKTGLKNFAKVLLIGSDCPSFTAEDFITALRALSTDNDLVIAPTEDGGYSLIGLKSPQPELFKDIPWSSAAVFTRTLAKLTALGLQAVELRTQWDVDTHADYVRYLQG
ncbi:MAG: TIGR04282 family arsenosugar biosynthesis glycosyltransferase [Methylococcales bacterium]